MTFQGKIYDGCVPNRDDDDDEDIECDWCSTKGKFLWSISILCIHMSMLCMYLIQSQFK